MATTVFNKPIDDEVSQIKSDISTLNSKLTKKTDDKRYTLAQGTSVGTFAELDVGDAKTFFGLSSSDTILGVFVANVTSSFGSTFNYYIAGNHLYIRVANSFTAGANAYVNFYALYE